MIALWLVLAAFANPKAADGPGNAVDGIKGPPILGALKNAIHEMKEIEDSESDSSIGLSSNWTETTRLRRKAQGVKFLTPGVYESENRIWKQSPEIKIRNGFDEYILTNPTLRWDLNNWDDNRSEKEISLTPSMQGRSLRFLNKEPATMTHYGSNCEFPYKVELVPFEDGFYMKEYFAEASTWSSRGGCTLSGQRWRYHEYPYYIEDYSYCRIYAYAAKNEQNPKKKKEWQLFHAACYGLKDTLKELLNEGVDPGIQDWRGRTPLMLSFYKKHTEIFETLAPLTDLSVDGSWLYIPSCQYARLTPQNLLRIPWSDRHRYLTAILKYHPKPAEVNAQFFPLAVDFENLEGLKQMAKYPLTKEQLKEAYEHAYVRLLNGPKDENWEIFKFILNLKPEASALLGAYQKYSVRPATFKVMSYLLQEGKLTEASLLNGTGSDNLLTLAARGRDFALVKELVSKYRFDPNYMTREYNALALSVVNPDVQMFNFLWDKTNLDQPLKCNRNLLHVAVESLDSHRETMIQPLLAKKKFDVNAKDCVDLTPLGRLALLIGRKSTGFKVCDREKLKFYWDIYVWLETTQGMRHEKNSRFAQFLNICFPPPPPPPTYYGGGYYPMSGPVYYPSMGR